MGFEKKATNVVWEAGQVSRDDREQRHGQKGVILWLTGLSGAGKTTVAVELERRLFEMGRLCYRLDGDNIRHGLNADLGFSPEDRDENIRRIGEVAKLFADAGFVAITSFISPYRKERDRVRNSVLRDNDFLEVFIECPLDVCEERDPKGMYKKARAGVIKEFTGISAPYEEPLNPEITIHTSNHTVTECAEVLIQYLEERGYLNGIPRPVDALSQPAAVDTI